VGKTFAMLSEAREQRERGVEVLAGYVETHGRKETMLLAEGLEVLPLRELEYRGVKLTEFDLDAALARKPQLILVDELAHTNAPESRHPKRWQDIEELLFACIDVYTTVNIQHLESLNDVVAQVTGVMVKETVPDTFIDRADEIEVVDIPPEELRQRLREGKVYLPERIEHALEGFFSTGNLIALRELALRRAADRVDAQMQLFRAQSGQAGMSTQRPRMIVCIAPNRLASRVVRSAGRIAASTHAEMIALYVESDRQARRSAEDHDRATAALHLAEGLGMETVTLSAHDIVGEVVRYAEKRGANLILVGKPIRARWREVVFGSVVDELVRRSGDIDVHVITGQPENRTSRRRLELPEGASVRTYLWTLATVALATGICELMRGRFERTNIVMIYLLAVASVSSRYGPREAVLAAVTSVLTFDFFFVPPLYKFAVSDTQYFVTFAVMLGVALLISSMTLRIRREARLSSERERRTAALFELSKELSRKRSKIEIAEAAAKQIRAVFDGDAAVLLPRDGRLNIVVKSSDGFEKDPKEHGAADWVCEHGEPAGKGTETLPACVALYLPLQGESNTLGVLAFRSGKDEPMAPSQRFLLETFVNGLALAIERANLAKEFHEARIQVESEKIRSALLSSISHDLRTPLTSIAGAASSLQAGIGNADELVDTIYHESIRLNVQVQNLLDMTRLQSGDVELNLDWQSAEELVGSALRRSAELLGKREIDVKIPEDLPLLRVDAGLVERVFVNLFENVAAHTPAGSPLEIRADVLTDAIRVSVADRGPGIPKGAEARVFERFFGRSGKEAGGFGLGLTIARAVMKLHDGRIWAKNRDDGPGAVFFVEFPKPTNPPEVPRG
jgi:two-component system sensor histidine kinase KdpD